MLPARSSGKATRARRRGRARHRRRHPGAGLRRDGETGALPWAEEAARIARHKRGSFIIPAIPRWRPTTNKPESCDTWRDPDVKPDRRMPFEEDPMRKAIFVRLLPRRTPLLALALGASLLLPPGARADEP